MARPHPVHAGLVWLADNLTSRGRNPDMVNDEWSGAEALENAFRVADEELRKVERERDEALARAEAAEARTAPAVTKADIEKAIRGKVWAANREPNKAGFHRVHVDWATDAVCDLFGIEAEPDPVEELAGQIETAARAAIRQVCDDLADVAPSLDPLAVEQAMEITAASRKVAAHVLRQEDRHVDQ